MINQSTTPGTGLVLNKRSLFAPHRLGLMIMWLAATIALVAMLAVGVRNTGQFRVLRYVIHAVYVVALLWHLIREKSPAGRLPDAGPLNWQSRKIGKFISIFIAALLFLTMFANGGLAILLLGMIIASIWTLIAWRKEIRFKTVSLGLAVTGIALLGGLPFWHNGFVSKSAFVLLLLFVPPMFVAGDLLLKHTGLGDCRLSAGRHAEAVKGFLWGCLLFVPLGLFNAASGSPGTDIAWVTRWWMPLSLPWFSGIAEEAWFRLFLVGLVYLILRPVFGKQPFFAVACSVLFSAITFGLGHQGTLLERFLTTGLLYGLPLAVVFVKRDWEHAVGAHYMINMIPWAMVFLKP